MARAKADPTERSLAISQEAVAEISARLRRVEGQVRALQQMIADRRDCHAIAQQMSAARSALERAMVQLMTESMVSCLGAGAPQDDRELKRLTETFVKLLS
jgi:DNA-binding FrmR family transcriptional regulator